MSQQSRPARPALTYEHDQSEDHARRTVVERYAAAAPVHLGDFGGKFAKRALATFARALFLLYGPAEADPREGGVFGVQRRGKLYVLSR